MVFSIEYDLQLEFDNDAQMKAFNGVTMSGSNYIASGNAFFGRKESDGTYSGCFLSSDQLQIGGNKMLGLYALKNNTVMVAIDPIAQQYYFRGIVYATDGEFKGTVKAEKGYFGGIVTGFTMNSTCIVTSDNASTYLRHYGTAKDYILCLDTINPIVQINSLPDNYLTSITFGGQQIKTLRLLLIPLTDSVESTQQALSLLGKTIVIYHKGYQITLVGNLLQDGKEASSSNIQSSITSTGACVKLTLDISSDGTFFWRYVAVTGSKFKPSTDFKPSGGTLVLRPDYIIKP